MSRDERAEQATHNVYVSMDRRERGLLSCEPPVCVWMCACDAALEREIICVVVCSNKPRRVMREEVCGGGAHA